MLKDGDPSNKLKVDTPELVVGAAEPAVTDADADSNANAPAIANANVNVAAEKSAEHLPDPLLGQVIAERLEILSAIGSGGMSTVYKARHLLLNRIVAVKVLRADKTNENAVVRFQQEAKAATALNHPNIAAVREFGLTEAGDPYLVMDYVEGKSLADVLQEDGAILVERTRNIMAQVCAGLQHAHSLGIVHRDLKPANIMLSTDSTGAETARIVDFGIAKMLQKDEQLEVTRAGEIFGTPLYMSPEQGSGKPVDARSDIYSLGCVMYECLSGKPPFVCTTALETLMQHLSEQPKPLKSSGDIAKIVLVCLEKQPADRYQSAQELRDALLDPGKVKMRNIPSRTNQSNSNFWRNLVIGITCFAIGLFFVVSSVIWPFLRPIVAPSNWERIASQARSNESNGNHELAKSFFRQAVAEADKEKLPEEKREMLYHDIGQFYSKNGNYSEAIKYLEKALAINSTHGQDFLTGSLNDWLCDAYLMDNQVAPAVTHGEAAVAIKKRLLGEHEYTLYALLHLGQAYRRAHNYSAAESTDREALVLANKLYPDGNSINLSDANLQLGNILADEGKNEEAIEPYKMALKTSLVARGNDSQLTAKARNELIKQLRALKRYDEANKIPPLTGQQ